VSYHVAVGLPDGRDAVADYRQPVTHVMHRINRQLAQGKPPKPDDLALVAEWLDHCPEQACSMALIAADGWAGKDTGCGGRHAPATSGPYTVPKYVRPVTGGLW
jgi:hypothetical protein